MVFVKTLVITRQLLFSVSIGNNTPKSRKYYAGTVIPRWRHDPGTGQKSFLGLYCDDSSQNFVEVGLTASAHGGGGSAIALCGIQSCGT